MPRIETVCFTGHRNICPEHMLRLPALLESTLRSLIEQGANCFRAGGAMGFDTLAALKVLELRQEYPAVSLHLYLPCRDQTRGWDEMSRRAYRYVLERADHVRYISEQYTQTCMLQRDRALVDGSDLCLAYCTRNRGGTFYTCSDACKTDVMLRNLYDELPRRQ